MGSIRHPIGTLLSESIKSVGQQDQVRAIAVGHVQVAAVVNQQAGAVRGYGLQIETRIQNAGQGLCTEVELKDTLVLIRARRARGQAKTTRPDAVGIAWDAAEPSPTVMICWRLAALLFDWPPAPAELPICGA